MRQMYTNKIQENPRTIQQLIDEFGYSYRDLEPLVGYSPSMICRLLNGQRTIRSRHRRRFAQVFGLKENQIIWPNK